MENLFKERAKMEGFKNPNDPKTWSVLRYLLPEMSVWAILEEDRKEARREVATVAWGSARTEARRVVD